jgi:hypothetical protein
MEWSQPAPQAWVDRLNQVVRPEGGSWLVLRWEPGEPWWPIERWAIWQVRPRSLTALLYPEHLKELDGLNPRRTGHACFPGWCPGHKAEEWSNPQFKMRWTRPGGDAGYIDYWQWKFYHETGGPNGGLFGTRWWVIQGDKGGHRWNLSQGEMELRQLRGMPIHTPLAGTLPYAPFDERVVEQIVAEDRLRRGLLAVGDLKAIAAQRDRMEAQERAAKEDAARTFVGRREDEMAANAAEFTKRWSAYHGDPRGPVTTKEDRIAAQRADEQTPEKLVQSIV